MRGRTTRGFFALVGALALTLSACTTDGVPADVELGTGVTEEPCPDAVNEDNGCIYLGVLSDLTVGPFAAFGPQLLAGETAFWQRVNEQGGIGGRFDVNISDFVRDTEYNPEIHRSAYEEIRTEVLGLSETLGTPPTLAIADAMASDDMVGAVSTWWSGWEFQTNILNAGSNYCIDAMNGLEWAQGEFAPESVLAVHFPGDYGEDAAAGVRQGADALGMEFLDPVTQIPAVAGGETSGAIATIVDRNPDLVFLTVGPTEAGEIVGGAAARGFEGQFLGSHPTFHQGLLASRAGPAFEAAYHVVGPHQNWGGDTPGHQAMREAFGDGAPDNDGYTFGWVLSYPMKAALDAAAQAGELNREGVLAAVETMAVDFEGMLPTKSYGDPNASVVRQTTISKPDSSVVADRLGLTVVEAAYSGSVAGGFEFTAPCFAIG